MCVCVRARVRVHVPERVCPRTGVALPRLALRAGAGAIPRAGKAGRSRNPHTEPTLLRATTGGADERRGGR